MTEYKQMTVEDWKAEIKASPTGCHRHIQNLLVKQAGGHPCPPARPTAWRPGPRS